MAQKFALLIVVVLFLLLFAATANAQITGLALVPVDNSRAAPALDNYLTTDLLVSFAGQYTGAQWIVELTAGSIYQDSFGGITPPGAALLPVVPSLEFDTFLAQGSAVSGAAQATPSPGGGAVDLGGSASAVFTATEINQAWNPAPGIAIVDQTDFLLARISLSRDALGVAHVLVSAAGERFIQRDIAIPFLIPIEPFPEPTSMTLASLGVILLAAGRRPSHRSVLLRI